MIYLQSSHIPFTKRNNPSFTISPLKNGIYKTNSDLKLTKVQINLISSGTSIFTQPNATLSTSRKSLWIKTTKSNSCNKAIIYNP